METRLWNSREIDQCVEAGIKIGIAQESLPIGNDVIDANHIGADYQDEALLFQNLVSYRHNDCL